MAVAEQYQADLEMILSHRHDNGADLWATPERNLIKGAPFSTVECAMLLLDLGMEPTEPLLRETAALLLSAWRKDGRFGLAPGAAILPCHVAIAARALCHLGYVEDARVQKTLDYLLDTQYVDGGWRCNKFSFGRGPETEYSNPHPTLLALDAFRFSRHCNHELALDSAVEFLLAHWTIRKPIGPCHYGIGTLFMQAEYPFRSYNLFQYVHVLSFYEKARADSRFWEAFETLRAKTEDGQIAVERVVPKLAGLSFCEKGKKSELATKRYWQILDNLGIRGYGVWHMPQSKSQNAIWQG